MHITNTSFLNEIIFLCTTFSLCLFLPFLLSACSFLSTYFESFSNPTAASVEYYDVALLRRSLSKSVCIYSLFFLANTDVEIWNKSIEMFFYPFFSLDYPAITGEVSERRRVGEETRDRKSIGNRFCVHCVYFQLNHQRGRSLTLAIKAMKRIRHRPRCCFCVLLVDS